MLILPLAMNTSLQCKQGKRYDKAHLSLTLSVVQSKFDKTTLLNHSFLQKSKVNNIGLLTCIAGILSFLWT